MSATPLENILKRDRAIVSGGLILLSLLAWTYLFHQARSMNMNMDNADMNMQMHMDMGMDMEMAMPQMQTWQAVDVLLVFIMWAVMMVGMMVPTAAPMVLVFAAVNRKRRDQQRPFVPTVIFLFGYLAVWASFALVATLAQWKLHSVALLSTMMVSTSPLLGGALLVAAGVFQWTPLKHTCLSHCRSPLEFLTSGWLEGKSGAFLMGLRHGAYCLGCCWILMSLLFVTGVMNILWIAIITAFVLAEKIAPAKVSPWVSRIAGVLLVGWGLWLAMIGLRLSQT